MISINDFMEVELIVAQIKEVEEHPDADRLYVIKVDTGKEEKRLVAGIKKSYSTDELIGKQVILVNNLEPAVIRGQESQGMILAVSDDDGISIIRPDQPVSIGCRVK